MPTTHVEGIGRRHAVFLHHALVAGGHDGRLGHGRAPLWMGLLHQGKHASHVGAGHGGAADGGELLPWRTEEGCR